MTLPSLPRPPSPFPNINPHTVKARTVLHRTHARAWRPAQFNPCLGQPTRFAPFNAASGACVPTLYAATNREAAAFESIFHDIDASAEFKMVRLDIVEARSVSQITLKRDLRLAGLFTPDLKAWRLQRSQLIDTPKSTYDQTVLWAQAIHAAHANIAPSASTTRPAGSVTLPYASCSEIELPKVISTFWNGGKWLPTLLCCSSYAASGGGPELTSSVSAGSKRSTSPCQPHTTTVGDRSDRRRYQRHGHRANNLHYHGRQQTPRQFWQGRAAGVP